MEFEHLFFLAYRHGLINNTFFQLIKKSQKSTKCKLKVPWQMMF